MTADRPRTYALLGQIAKFHCFPEETEGKYCFVEIISPPGTGAPPNHHAGEMETFFMLEGAAEFMINGKVQTLSAGQSAIVPDGALHAFTVVGDKPARMLIINAPGVMHDKFFTGIGMPVPDGTEVAPPPDGPPDIPALVQFAASLGMTIPVPEDA